MYLDVKLSNEALRVAQKHAPHMIHQINQVLSAGPQAALQSGDQILESAKMWESQRDYQKAIDRYLEITDQHFQNPAMLEDIYVNCFNIAMTYAKDRVQEVVSIVGTRLFAIGRFESAGEILE